MFICNLKINGGRALKIIILVLSLFMLFVFGISIYKIFFTSGKFNVNDKLKAKDITELDAKNYTNILQAVTEDIDSYIGCKVHFTGYVYRLIDFDKNEFVLARDMIVNENTSQSLVVGFLCTYDTAYEFKDNTWVDITGTIVKGEYYGDIAQIKVDNMFECNEPENKFVSVPDNSYVPTSSMF